jgi:hypothetical protein
MPFDTDSWDAFSQDGLSAEKQLMIVSSLIRACEECVWLGVFSSSLGSSSIKTALTGCHAPKVIDIQLTLEGGKLGLLKPSLKRNEMRAAHFFATT